MSDTSFHPLHEAAANGEIDALNRLLEDGADLDGRDDTGRTPLFCAAKSGEAIAARHLLKRGARVDCVTHMGTTAIVTAARGGHVEMVHLLLANGADPNQIVHPQPIIDTPEQEEAMRKLCEKHGMPIPTEQEREASRLALEAPRMSNSLAAAMIGRDRETIVALIEAGADVNNASGPSGMPPLRVAVSFSEPDIIRLLLKHGARVNAGADSENDNSALSSAVMKQRVDVARILLEAGADPNTAGHMPPLSFAVQFNNLEMVKLLLEFGANSDARLSIMAMARNKPEILAAFAAHRGTDWHEMVAAGDIPGVSARLDAGVAIDVPDDKGKTALILAAETGDANLVEMLLERGADPNASDNLKITPLMQGARKSHADVVRLLLDRGADVNAVNKWGQNALSSTLSDEKREIRELLVAGGAVIGIVESAFLGDNVRVIACLADGAPVDHANSSGMTAMMGAAARGDIALARTLHERGADVSLVNTLGQDAFHIAVQNATTSGDTALLALLLEWGADINRIGSLGSSALLTPAFAGAEGIMRFLLDHGADPNGPGTKFDQPLLHTTIMLGRGNIAPIKILLEYGAEVDATNNAESTTLMETIGLSRIAFPDDADRADYIRSVAKLLIDYGANVNAKARRTTVLTAALRSGDIDLVRLVLDAGADIGDVGSSGPLTLRTMPISPEIIALLRERGVDIPEPIEPPSGMPEGFAASLAEGKMPPDFMNKMLDIANARRNKKGA